MYTLLKFSMKKNTFVFWNAVKNYDIAEEMIYEVLKEKDEFIKRPELKISTEQGYHIFRGVYTVVGCYDNDPLSTKECRFRGHYIMV